MTYQVFPRLYELSPSALQLFSRILQGQLEEAVLNLERSENCTPVDGTGAFSAGGFTTAKEMASAVCNSFGTLKPQEYADRLGLWAWLTFVLLDVLFPKQDGKRKVGDYFRWYPAAARDYQKAQRHLVRMPVLLYSAFGDNADHLLAGKPGVGTEIREQLTSQQDMFSENFQKACRALYFDDTTGRVKRRAGGKGPGVPRRLAQVRKQLDVTWDMTDLPWQRIVHLLPSEFDAFKPSGLDI